MANTPNCLSPLFDVDIDQTSVTYRYPTPDTLGSLVTERARHAFLYLQNPPADQAQAGEAEAPALTRIHLLLPIERRNERSVPVSGTICN
jgi:hypothetical protein